MLSTHFVSWAMNTNSCFARWHINGHIYNFLFYHLLSVSTSIIMPIKCKEFLVM